MLRFESTKYVMFTPTIHLSLKFTEQIFTEILGACNLCLKMSFLIFFTVVIFICDRYMVVFSLKQVEIRRGIFVVI